MRGLRTLRIIARSDGATQRHVAFTCLDINRSAVTTMVLRLEALGLVPGGRSTLPDWPRDGVQPAQDGTIMLDKARNAFDAINAAIDGAFNDHWCRARAARPVVGCASPPGCRALKSRNGLRHRSVKPCYYAFSPTNRTISPWISVTFSNSGKCPRSSCCTMRLAG